MYAIAKCGGKQFRLEPRAMVRVPVLETPVGGKVRIEEILFLSDGSKVEIGRPLVEGAYAEAVVVRHGRHRKVRIIKYKRRKGYRRTIGHRQWFTELEIGEIVLGGKKKAAAPAKEKEAAPVAAPEALEAGKPAQAVPEPAAEPKRKRAVKAEAAPKSAKESAEKAKAEAKPKRTVKAPAKGKAATEKPAAKPAAKAGAKKKASDKSEGAGKRPVAARKRKAEKEEPKKES
ncbi:MAG: 50S ribosomal protein L21 [Candidatus Glassbacteria bacterium RIFCSPLOWO2_12_FULL_58_11]|uniref:Large ribosomal subunit protein bL21 n=1 Tax=Candidatus Glassbacteria bacterium RIFCSPLOWO2_12_FULL_58_11 TaxID=1817867 RepID=A0A1F5YM24_9BACT|nr:MAG: 50S ribosomal protein L21 [Candidatus Glassbacteria bacterium RIFCSPLOWO2_12_FULL_58_11]